MWKNLAKTLLNNVQTQSIVQQQIRTTFILKRRFPPPLHKAEGAHKRLKRRHYIYEFVENKEYIKQPNIEVVLTQYVDGVGDVGDVVSVRPHFAYNKLLLPLKAIYALPENKEKFKDIVAQRSEKQHSSATAQIVVSKLENLNLSVVMNKDNPWVLKPWHVRNSFRRCGYIVPDECIQLPDKEIAGPNLDYEGKEFFVTVTINNLEKANVRCFLHHWSTDVLERLPYEKDFFKRKHEPIFSEFLPVLDKIPARSKLVEDVEELD